ncbi:MAG: CHRD domain-containing protein, partial [Ginsengibacter sp.]
EFYNGATLLGTATTSPYTFTWTGVAEGKYLITAKATDNSGAVTTSSVVNVAVDPTFKATLNGANERPTPNTSTATGSATLIFNIDTKIFTVTTTYSGLTGTASAGHIHKGDATIAGPVLFGFTNVSVSPIVYTSIALDAAQEADLRAGLHYVNVHTALYPGGEIRGQLIKQ